MFKFFDLRDQLRIVRDEGETPFQLMLRHAVADKNLTRLGWVDTRVADRTPAVHHEAVQGRALIGLHLTGFFAPARFGIRFAEQMRRDALQPFRLDFRNRARK